MDKNYFSIAQWIAGYLCGNRDTEEQAGLEEWRKEVRNEQLIRKIKEDSQERMERGRYNDFPCQQGWAELQGKRDRRYRLHLLRQWGSVAAVCLLCLGGSLFFWLRNEKPENNFVPVVAQQTEVGSSGVRLILGSGEVIDLTEQQGMIGDSLASIRNAGRCLTYEVDSLNGQHVPVYHELDIPMCGEYQLQLCDGTMIYLNAMTKLRFPNFFQGGVREVELEGEAYFKVAKNPERPFVVRSANSVVYVYGTEFNVSAYPDESESHTTLVEGRLAVENSGGRRDIRPGEQWNYDKESGKVTVKPVDVTLYTAWKERRMRFNDVRLEEIMRSVHRWYGVEVSYQSEDLKDLRFGCNFNRDSSIEPLLRVFEANGKIKIEQKGNQLMIKRGH